MDRQIRKTRMIQLAALIMGILLATAAIAYRVDTAADIDPSQKTQYGEQPIAEGEYDPLADIAGIRLNDLSSPPTFDYVQEIAKFPSASALRAAGYSVSADSYNGDSSRVALVQGAISFGTEFSQTEYTVSTPVTTEAKRGGYRTEYKTEKAKCPVLRPYYGYIIYTTAAGTKLLNSDCSILAEDITGYDPAYMTTSAGDPLFVKNGKYYFYYNGIETHTPVYEEIKGEGYDALYPTVPSAYQYFTLDTDVLMNYYASGMTDNSMYLTEIAMSLPEEAGMVEYLVDPQVRTELAVPVMNYGRGSTDLIPFYTRVYTKTLLNETDVIENGAKPSYSIVIGEEVLWGYMDRDGNTVIEPQFKAAYGFGPEGYAITVDDKDSVCIIDNSGRITVNAYKTLHYFSSLSNKKLRDGYYLPDTYGIESLGMFTFNNGYVRMRRKLTDSGKVVKRETDVLVATDGSLLNYPADCKLISYSDGMLLLERDGLYGYMNYLGQWVIEPKLIDARPFCEGLAVVAYATKQYGVINNVGQLVLPTMYRHIENCSGGVITAFHHKGGWTVYNKLSSTAPVNSPNPVAELKKRAVAQAKYEYYIKVPEVIEPEETEEILIDDPMYEWEEDYMEQYPEDEYYYPEDDPMAYPEDEDIDQKVEGFEEWDITEDMQMLQ